MNGKSLAVILAIVILGTGVWAILAGTVACRTSRDFSQFCDSGREGKLCGYPLAQAEPIATPEDSAAPETPTIEATGPTAIVCSRVMVDLRTGIREYKLRRFPVYTVDFTGKYTVRNNGASGTHRYMVQLDPPRARYQSIFGGGWFTEQWYTEFTKQQVRLNGEPVKGTQTTATTFGRQWWLKDKVLGTWAQAVTTPPLGPGESAEVEFSYQTTGMGSWTYLLPSKRPVEDLTVTASIDTPDGTVPPTFATPAERTVVPNADGQYTMVWHAAGQGADISIAMPAPLQPGPVATKMTFLGPVSLFFFFALLVTLQRVRRLPLGPRNYIWLAAAFIAFHLVLVCLIGYFGLMVSFWIAAATSFLLVVTYLGLVLGRRAEVAYAGLCAVVCLVPFGYSFIAGGPVWNTLAVTVGVVATLAALLAVWRARGAQAVTETQPSEPALMRSSPLGRAAVTLGCLGGVAALAGLVLIFFNYEFYFPSTWIVCVCLPLAGFVLALAVGRKQEDAMWRCLGLAINIVGLVGMVVYPVVWFMVALRDFRPP